MSPLVATVSMLGRMVASFHPRALPPMLRRNYGLEFASWWLLSIMIAAVEGGVIGVIVKNTYADVEGVPPNLLNFVVAALAAAPALANITSFVWASMSHGRLKVRFIVMLQVATAIATMMAALAPVNAGGLLVLAASVYVARICWAGVVTIRTTVWRNNYPRANRAKIAGRLATVQSAVISAVSLAMGFILEWNNEAFHVVYPLTGLCGLLGVMIYARVRLRGQKRLMRSEREGRVGERPTLNPVSVLEVLRDDPSFRAYMLCMFVFGIGNIMLSAPLTIILKEQFNFGIDTGVLVMTVIPMAVMPTVIPLWARLLDRTHIVHFRAIHSWSFVAVSALLTLATLFDVAWLLFIVAVMQGVAFGGGVLAWNLGHHDFAPSHRSSQYMGVHVTLTGIRGLIAPFLGVYLYQKFRDWPPTAGGLVFGVTLALNLIGAIGFVVMSQRMTRRAARQSGDSVA